MTDARRPDDRADEFYVNYLPMPAGLRRVVVFAVGALLWLAAGAGFFWARAQQTPGEAVWNDATPTTLTGTLVTEPFPVLFADGGEGGTAVPVILVETGKIGSQARAAPLGGQRVAVRGWTLDRDGRRMLELDPAADAIAPAAGEPEVPASQLGAAVTLRGEIVDYKCFLGAMKPGAGKPHKACATLCIRGGIPPVLVVTANGTRTYYLLVTESGGPWGESLLPVVGDVVDVAGTLESRGPLTLLRVGAGGISRP